MTARLRTLALALSLAASAARPALATPPAYVGGQFRYWVFDDGNNMRDVLAYFARPTWHVQLEYWDGPRSGSTCATSGARSTRSSGATRAITSGSRSALTRC